MNTLKMWNKKPMNTEYEPVLEYYPAENKKTDSAIVIFPGGGYTGRAPHEGKGYAEFFNKNGIDAFVLEYHTYPDLFPIPLADARRSIRYVRFYAEKFGINPDKIAVMGSSAGGHLAALVSTYKEKIDFENTDEIDEINPIPNYQILCYPVITLSDISKTHAGSIYYLLNDHLEIAPSIDPSLIATKDTPPAFIWHTSDDELVNVYNSLKYGEVLRDNNVKFEMHIFPEGRHGLGLSEEKPYVSKWSELLLRWLELYNLL